MMLGRGDDQPGVAAGQLGEIAGRADRRVELLRRAGRPDFRGSRVDRLDDLGLARPEQRLAAVARRRPARARCPRRRRRSPPICRSSCLHPRAAHRSRRRRSSGQRARAGASSAVDQPGGEALAPRPRRSSPHCRCTASSGGTRRRRRPCARGERVERRRGPRWLAATPPATTSARRVADRRARARVRSTRQSTTACWKLAAMSAGRCSPLATARSTALLSPAKEKCGSSLPEQRARQRHRARHRPRRASARPPGRRDSRGRAAWRSCRTPRRRHRRWWWRAGGSGRRPRPRATGNARPRRAAADRESRGRDRPAAGDSAWPSRWLTAISGLPRGQRQRPCR